MTVQRFLASTVVAALTVTGCSDQPAPTAPGAIGHPLSADLSHHQPGRYIVLFAAEQVPADFGERVATLGGSVEASLDDIGVATVTGLTATAAADLAVAPEVHAVESDGTITVDIDGVDAAGAFTESTAGGTFTPTDATASPTAAQFYPRQWNMRAVFADQAWAAGLLGSRDVKVAILDSGIDYTLPDFAGLVDLGRSKSLAPEEDPVVAERYPGRLSISDLLAHGTAVASIIGSNGSRLAAVNRDITLIAVKIWNRFNQGAFSRVLSGIVYAADQGADVINVSGSYTFDKSMNPGIVAAMNRAANYAFRKGALLISVAGNFADDLDHNGDTVRLPCEAAHAICASATGPAAAVGPNGPWENVDAMAAYTSFGRSAVDVAAPGGAGDFSNPDPVLSGTQFRRMWILCTTTAAEALFGACKAGLPIAQPFGTSFAAAHVSGLAALLVAQLGHGKPGRIRSRILHSADDLGAPGKDPYYGWGRINIARALGLLGGIDRDEDEDKADESRVVVMGRPNRKE